MKKLLKLAVLSALMVLLCLSTHAADAVFDPTIEVERTETSITVTVQSDADTNAILAEKKPTLSIPCSFAAAKVTFDGKTVSSTLADGEISFRVAAGGVYTISEKPVPVYDDSDFTGETEPEKEKITVPDFTDVNEDNWFYEDVRTACEMGLMIGVSDDRFDPMGNGTRGMVFTMLARYAGIDTEGGSTWYEKGVAWAVAEGLSDGTNPEALITREQIVTLFYRYLGGTPGDAEGLNGFDDADSVSAWAKDAVTWAVEKGILQGKGNGRLDPRGTASRAEIAALFVRVLGDSLR